MNIPFGVHIIKPQLWRVYGYQIDDDWPNDLGIPLEVIYGK